MGGQGLLIAMIIGLVTGGLAWMAGNRRNLLGNIVFGLLGAECGAFITDLFDMAFISLLARVLASMAGAMVCLAVFRATMRDRAS